MKTLKFKTIDEIEKRIVEKYGRLFIKSINNQIKYSDVIVKHG